MTGTVLNGKRLKVNTEKTKIMGFRKGGGRLNKREWRWKGKRIEEVKELRYLGCVAKKWGAEGACKR